MATSTLAAGSQVPSEYHLTEDEKKNAKIMFEYCCQGTNPYLQRSQLKQATQFFLSQYEGIYEQARKNGILIITKQASDQTNFVQFSSVIHQIKKSNGGLKAKKQIQLDNEFILTHLQENQIFHIDDCWGTFDKKSLGYLEKFDIKECIDLVLQRYDLSNMSCLSNSMNVSINIDSHKNDKKQHFTQITLPKINSSPSHQQNNLTSQNTQPSIPTQQSLQNNQIQVFSQQMDNFTSAAIALNVAAPEGINIKKQQNNHSSVQGLQTNKKHQKNHNQKDKSATEGQGSLQIIEIRQWLDSLEVQRLISFEEFANFIAQLIVDNKLKFFSKTRCNCSIF